jgi:hypothetical protein
MRRSLSVLARLALMVAVLGVLAARVEAITLAEIVELTRAGLGEEVLLALIEVDQRVFAIDPDTLKTLKDAGVSPRVIVAIVKSGRTPAPQSDPVVTMTDVEPPPPTPQVVVVDRTVVHEVPIAVPVPVYVAIGRRSRAGHRDLPYVVPPSPFIPFGNTAVAHVDKHKSEPRRHAEPVYWGWGGKRRPDSWQPK